MSILLGLSASIYSGVWRRFVKYLTSEKIPAGKVSEITVLDYLSSRLKPPGIKCRVKGKLSPQSLGTELYGLISPLCFVYGVAIDPTSRWSISKDILLQLLKCLQPD